MYIYIYIYIEREREREIRASVKYLVWYDRGKLQIIGDKMAVIEGEYAWLLIVEAEREPWTSRELEDEQRIRGAERERD